MTGFKHLLPPIIKDYFCHSRFNRSEQLALFQAPVGAYFFRKVFNDSHYPDSVWYRGNIPPLGDLTLLTDFVSPLAAIYIYIYIWV